MDVFSLNSSPLFRWGVQRIHWLHRRPQPFSTYRRRAALVIVTLSLSLTVIIYRVFNIPYSLPNEGLIAAGLLLTIASLILGTLFDLLPIASVARYYKRDTIYHDLLRVSPLSIHDNILAYHELARIDSWRSVTSLSIIRLVGTLLLMGGIAANNLADIIREPSYYSDEYIFSLIYFLACFGVGTLIIALEPQWRIQAMSALAVALAVRMRQEWTRLFVNILLVLVHWLIFPLFVGVVVFFMVCVSRLDTDPFTLRYIFIPVALYAGLRGWYAWITNRCLSYAKWRMFRQHSEA